MRIAITGAQSYTGRYVSQLLLKNDKNSIVNLTNHHRSWSINSERIENRPLVFERQSLVESLRGCSTLVQTYWVRFDNTLGMTRDQVTNNSKMMIDCAKQAGVKKIIYTSHTQTSMESPLDYIRQKAKVQAHLKQSGMKWGIVRPCGIFGRSSEESIIMNNLAYLVRKFPLFPMPGDGKYIFQLVHVEDMAELILKCIQSDENHDLDAVGPDRTSFKDIIQHLSKTLNTTCIPVTGINKNVSLALTAPLNWYFDDILMDTNDLDIMTSGLTCSLSPPTGSRSLYKWIEDNKDNIGRNWVSSVKRYYQK